MKSLTHWRQYLGWTREQFIILSDHDNLRYWKSPRNLNRRTARWHADLQEYDYLIQHIPGKENIPADALSRPPNADRGKDDNQGISVIPPERFANAAQLEDELTEIQKRANMVLVHDHPTAGHPGRDETIRKAKTHTTWTGMNQWIADYVKGCATCQQNKILIHKKRAPLYRITTNDDALPFQQVAMDLITGLPLHNGKDAILTIVDHGCSRAAIFLPCTTKITGLGIAQLYMDHVYRWFGLPTKIISDRDPRFTSHFGRALTEKVGIHQNLSTVFHPQTDGISERKNQWIEQYLRLVTSASPEDWTYWLAIATAVHNNRRNETTDLSPNQILLGFETTLVPSETPLSNNQSAEDRLTRIKEKRAQAIDAINQTQKGKRTIPSQYEVGGQVWLEATNLKIRHQKTKLAPKRYGPFKIVKEISPVAYQIKLPSSWGIHDVFHASLLSPYHETTAHGPNFSRPPPDVIGGEEEYAVEKIISHRAKGRSKRVEYLIKWEGYPHSDNTWEPTENIHAPDLLNAYRRRAGIKTASTLQLGQCSTPASRPWDPNPESPLCESLRSNFSQHNRSDTSSSYSSTSSPNRTSSNTRGSANITIAHFTTPTETCPNSSSSATASRSPTPPLRYPLNLPPVRNLCLLDPPPLHYTKPWSRETTKLLKTLLKTSSKPCGRGTKNTDSWLESWRSEPESCWIYSVGSREASQSLRPLQGSSSTGSTRPYTSSSPSRRDTPNQHIGSNVFPTDKSPPSPKSTPPIKNHTLGISTSKPSSMKTRNPLGHSQYGFTTPSSVQPEAAFKSFTTPTRIF